MTIDDDDDRGGEYAGDGERLTLSDRNKFKAPSYARVTPTNFLPVDDCSLNEYDAMSKEGFEDWKVFNDCIYNHIYFPPICVRIIDTPEFQRLRNLKQLGSCHFVYPNATHSRFQHSLGVGHLAAKFAKTLQLSRPDLITDVDILCLQIAGLCHDLGHGPYSHLWESFIRKINPDNVWCHEKNSIKMFNKLIKENELETIFAENKLYERDIVFIKELIAGPSSGAEDYNGKAQYLGRDSHKHFLYDIIANKKSGIDVDKLDYFQRDDYYLNVGIYFKYQRFAFFISVLEVDGQNRLCVRDKEAHSICDIFRDRARLHDRAYQHKVVLIVQNMMMDAFILAEPFIKIRFSDGDSKKTCTLAQAAYNPRAFQLLTDDYVIFKIIDSEDERVDPARQLLKRIEKRDFYHVILEWRPRGLFERPDATRFMNALLSACPIPDSVVTINIEGFSAFVKYIDCGEGDKKRAVLVYDKEMKDVKEHTIHGLKDIFFLTFYVVYKKSVRDLREEMKKISNIWKEYLNSYGEDLLKGIQ